MFSSLFNHYASSVTASFELKILFRHETCFYFSAPQLPVDAQETKKNRLWLANIKGVGEFAHSVARHSQEYGVGGWQYEAQ